MSLSRTGKLLQYVNYRMRVTLTDGRQICGRQVHDLPVGSPTELQQQHSQQAVAPLIPLYVLYLQIYGI
jgi:hypothetical protein